MAAVTICSDLESNKIKSVTVSVVSPSICYEVLGPDAVILAFWMLSFKPAFSLSSFTFIKRLFSFSSLSGIRVVSSVYLRLWIFLPLLFISLWLAHIICWIWLFTLQQIAGEMQHCPHGSVIRILSPLSKVIALYRVTDDPTWGNPFPCIPSLHTSSLRHRKWWQGWFQGFWPEDPEEWRSEYVKEWAGNIRWWLESGMLYWDYGRMCNRVWNDKNLQMAMGMSDCSRMDWKSLQMKNLRKWEVRILYILKSNWHYHMKPLIRV